MKNSFNKYIPHIIFTFSFLILIMLGNWQLKRYDEKMLLIKNIEHNLSSPSIPLNKNPNVFSKIFLEGHFVEGQYIFLYGRRSAETEKDGYYLLSIFKNNDGKKYLVSRGWLPFSAKDNIKNFAELRSETINAIVMNGETKGFMVPENDIKNHIWFTVDLKLAHTILDIESNFYLMQINSNNLPLDTKPLTGNNLNKIRNDHLEYAITWYCLALSLLIIFIIKIKKPH